MAIQITTTEGIGTDKVKILIYGGSSMGKTTLLGGLKGKTLIISAEAGLLVLRDKKMDVAEVKNLDDFKEVFIGLKDGTLKYDNVAIDSLTEVADMLIDELSADEYYGNPSNAFVLWKEYSNQLSKIVKAFRNLPVNVIFTALEDSLEENGMIVKTANIQGKSVKSKLMSLFDEFYRLHSDKEGNRFLSTTSTNIYQAKSRAGVFEKEIPVPEGADVLGDILEKIANSCKKLSEN